MQAACSGSEVYISGFAVPQAGAAVHALLAIKGGNIGLTSRDRLSRTHFDARLCFTLATNLGPNEYDVIGVSRRSLDSAAYQQRVLMRDQQLVIKRNSRPPTAVHKTIVQTASLLDAVLLQVSQFGCGNPGCKE